MQKDLVSETVSLAQRLHKHLSIRIVDLVVDCATSTSLLLRIVVVLYETQYFVTQVSRALVPWSRMSGRDRA